MASRARTKNLRSEQLDEAIRLIADGNKVATVARKFGVTRNALYNRQRRGRKFAEEIETARADAAIKFLRMLQAAAASNKAWQAFAWILERDHGWVSPGDKAKLAAASAAKPLAGAPTATEQAIALWAAARATLPAAAPPAPPAPPAPLPAPDAPAGAPQAAPGAPVATP